MIHFNYSTKDVADSLGEIKQYIDVLEQAEHVWEEAMFTVSVFENCQLIRTLKDMLGRMLKAEKTAEEIDAYRFFASQNVELILGRSLLEKDKLGVDKHLDVSDYKQIYYLSQVYCDMQIYSAIVGYMTPAEYKNWFENDSKKYRKTTCSSFADIIPPALYEFIYSKGYGSIEDNYKFECGKNNSNSQYDTYYDVYTKSELKQYLRCFFAAFANLNTFLQVVDDRRKKKNEYSYMNDNLILKDIKDSEVFGLARYMRLRNFQMIFSLDDMSVEGKADLNYFRGLYTMLNWMLENCITDEEYLKWTNGDSGPKTEDNYINHISENKFANLM